MYGKIYLIPNTLGNCSIDSFIPAEIYSYSGCCSWFYNWRSGFFITALYVIYFNGYHVVLNDRYTGQCDATSEKGCKTNVKRCSFKLCSFRNSDYFTCMVNYAY